MERIQNKMEHTESEQQIIDALKKADEEFKKTMAKNPKNVRSIVRRKYCLKWDKLNSNGCI